MTPPEPPVAARFRPHATRELGGMFDDVAARYDWLNRVMSLGQDRAWRVAMWRSVPESARAVLDLCTGSGTSLSGLRRPGRLVLGVDVSRRMLAIAADREGRTGWAARLVCADGFHLPLRDRMLDAITIAFGVRNLRPLADALAELARVLRPNGTLVVLEAAGPAPGPLAAFHAFYLRRVIPLAGRLSTDPSAYAYLSRSIFEFGSGPNFERALASSGFEVTERHRFMLGATRLWVARRATPTGQIVAAPGAPDVQNARPERREGVSVPSRAGTGSSEWRLWTGVQLVLAVALTAVLAYGLWVLVKSGSDLPLSGWQRPMAAILLGGGLAVFAVRAMVLLARYIGPAPRG